MSDLIRERSASLSDFSGGLNNYWDPSSIAKNEVPYLLNMDFSPNGALISRPPIIDSGITPPVSGEYVDILGFYTPANGPRYIVATSNSKTWVRNLTAGSSWVEVWAHKASSFIQYNDEAVFSKKSVGGLRWTLAAGATAIPTMPALDGLAIFRDRFFGWGVANTVNQTRLYFSDIITLAEPTGVYTWNTDSVFNVGRGDGQRISSVIADYSKLIIFKSNSTYSLTYSALVEEGTISLIQQGIGAENPDCVAGYQNGYVVLHDQNLYKFLNDSYAPLNAQKVNFEGEEIFPGIEPTAWVKDYAVSVFGDRAIVWFNGISYVLNLLTGTWSIWDSPFSKIAIIKQRARLADEALPYEVGYGVTGSPDSSKWKIYEIDNVNVIEDGSEEFECRVRTRIYDFDRPAEWKRLYWWAIDMVASGQVRTEAQIVGLFSYENEWRQMDLYTWDFLEFGTWDTPINEAPPVETIREIPAGRPQRTLLKLENGLRFRRIFFEVYFTCDGTKATAPTQVFSITPMIGEKAKMTKGVN